MINNSVGKKRMSIVSPIPTVKTNKAVSTEIKKEEDYRVNRLCKIHTLIKKYVYDTRNLFTKINLKAIPVNFISRKNFYKVLTVTAVTSIVFTIGLSFDLGFDAYLGSHYIGVVKGYEEADEIIDKISRENNTVKPTQPPQLYLKIISKGNFSNEDTVEDNVRLAIGVMQRAVLCSINGVDPFYVESETVLNEALSQYMAQYRKYGEPSIDKNIKKSDAITYVDAISDREEVVKILSDNCVPVKTIEYISKQVETEYEVRQIEDNTKPKGTVIVNKNGENGIADQQIKVSRINGELSGEEVISSETVVAAVARIETVGTRETPEGKGTGKFIYPVNAPVTSSFGSRWGRQHEGTDFGAELGTDILAADSGTVIFSGWESGYGNLVIIDHKNGYKTYYAHCSKIYVNTGCTLMAGDVIATVGNTGNSTGAHLHFEIRYNDQPLNALTFLQ